MTTTATKRRIETSTASMLLGDCCGDLLPRISTGLVSENVATSGECQNGIDVV